MCNATRVQCGMLAARHLIFTDLDGTLLDARTYSWAGAEPALAEIERRRIPLILVTSKTRAEVEPLRRKLSSGWPRRPRAPFRSLAGRSAYA